MLGSVPISKVTSSEYWPVFELVDAMADGHGHELAGQDDRVLVWEKGPNGDRASALIDLRGDELDPS